MDSKKLTIEDGLSVQLEFRGGAESLFNVQTYRAALPFKDHTTWTMKDLLIWLKDNLLSASPDLFLRGDTVRPGFIVAVNDVDWELLGDIDYELKVNDHVLFISSLHGG